VSPHRGYHLINLPAVKITDVATAFAGPIPFRQSTDGSYRSISPRSDVVSVSTTISTITSAGTDDEEESIVFDQHGWIVQMDPMLYDALSGLVEDDAEAYRE